MLLLNTRKYERANSALISQVLTFIVVGGSAFVLDAGGYFVLTRFSHFNFIVARSISLSISLCWNFLLNRYWTFRSVSGAVGRQIVRYLIVIFSTSLINLALMKIGVEKLHLSDMLVLVTVSILIGGINFIVHRNWSYYE